MSLLQIIHIFRSSYYVILVLVSFFSKCGSGLFHFGLVSRHILYKISGFHCSVFDVLVLLGCCMAQVAFLPMFPWSGLVPCSVVKMSICGHQFVNFCNQSWLLLGNGCPVLGIISKILTVLSESFKPFKGMHARWNFVSVHN